MFDWGRKTKTDQLHLHHCPAVSHTGLWRVLPAVFNIFCGGIHLQIWCVKVYARVLFREQRQLRWRLWVQPERQWAAFWPSSGPYLDNKQENEDGSNLSTIRDTLPPYDGVEYWQTRQFTHKSRMVCCIPDCLFKVSCVVFLPLLLRRRLGGCIR